jgi:PAS domain S-box-containing protein
MNSAHTARQSPAAGFERLRKEQLRYILNNISDLLCLHDLEGHILAVNCTLEDQTGMSWPRWYKGKKILQFIPEKYHQEFRSYLHKLSEEGSASGIVSLRGRGGVKRIREYNSLLIHDDRGETVVLARLGPDIREQLKSAKALKKSEEKYRSILDTIEDGYYEVDLKGHITFCNPSLCRILGYCEDELLQMDYRRVCDPADLAKIRRTFAATYQHQRPTKAFDWKLIRKDGSVCFIEASVSLIEDEDQQVTGFRGICRDVTERIEAEKERQSLEAQLLFSQKTEALGTLAAGFAHNFNNILFPLIGYIDMTLMEMPEGSTQRKHLKKAMEAANRAKEIIRRVQEYTRNDKDHQMQPVSVPETVQSALRLVRVSLSRRIRMEVEMPEASPVVVADPNKIEQLVVNLCTNASEAIAASGGSGRIEVSVGTKKIGSEADGNPAGLPAGRYACISVRDSGCGIAPEAAERIFDPFFTTKAETGKGLGLALSLRIVKKYGGEIYVESRPEEGTAVYVYLPLAEEPKSSRTQPESTGSSLRTAE